jgi:hypothetical protein
MGRFGASLLLLLGACGDNLGDESRDLPDPDLNPGDLSTIAPRFTPEVCGVMAWDGIGIDTAQDISVAARPTYRGGATVFATPLGGGTITGFQLDTRMDMESGTAQKLPITNGAFSTGTVSYIQNRPVSAAIAEDAVYIHMLDESLQTAEYITKLPATSIADPTFFYAQGNLVMPVGTKDGLWMHRFQDSLEPIDSKLFKSSKPVLSVTSAQLQTYMMTAFSTETECHLLWNTTYEPGVSTKIDTPCPKPRLAMDESTGDAVMLFDSLDGIRMMLIHLTMFGGDAPVVRADATSPRALFDGKRFWLSYIDPRGDVVVGFLDDKNRPITTSLGAPKPERDAYELVMVNGSPTVFSLDDSGYTAYRMCAIEQQ